MRKPKNLDKYCDVESAARGLLGELVWRADVAHNAYRLQVVRAEATGATKDTK